MGSFKSPGGAMAPPPTPAPKRPSLSQKRDSSYLDTDDEAGLSSSTKKLRVAFDDKVHVRIMDEWNDKSFDLVKEEVRLGIQRHLAPAQDQDDTQYNKLIQCLAYDAFSSEALSTKLLGKYVTALSTRMSVLGDCGRLVNTVLDMSWIGRAEEFVEIYTKFLNLLASNHAKFIAPIMERLVTPFHRLPASRGRLPGEDPVSRGAMFDRLHAAIELILSRSPSASGPLVRMLKLQFPNDLSSAKAHLQYQMHVLRIAEHIPQLRDEVLALIVQRLVGLDVQIQQDIDEFEEDQEAKLLQHDRSALDSDDSDSESESESEVTETEEQLQLRELKLKVAKLDATLDLLFTSFSTWITKDGTPGGDDIYELLLLHFDNFILCNRSRHVQFLLFHFSQTTPENVDQFIEHCRDIVESNGAITNRLTACAYLASFVARGSHIPTESVRYVFNTLCQFLETMRQRYEPSCAAPDRRSFGLYYAVAQALFYIFCFRWRDLVIGSTMSDWNSTLGADEILADGHDLTWLPGVKETLTANVNSVLNPLKVCSAAIVSEFAQIANHLRFLYVFSLLERNKRIRLGGHGPKSYAVYPTGGSAAVDLGHREGPWDRKAGEAHYQLEAYFPFDPYHLPKSKRWIAGEYIEWTLPRGMKPALDDDCSDSDDGYSSDDGSVLDELPDDQMRVADTISVSS